eukprot:symbB.v1.2.014229.t1/scaffold1035.1/size234022/5
MRLLVDFVDPDGSLCAAAQLAAVEMDPAVTAVVRVVQGDLVAVALGTRPRTSGASVPSSAASSAVTAPALEVPTVTVEPAVETTVEKTPRFLVFGANTAGVAAGNLQKAISAAFPEQFLDLQEQIVGREQEEADGEVYVSRRTVPGNLWLIAVVCFPRNRNEFAVTKMGFQNALRCALQLTEGNGVDVCHVLTHALGSFTGHPGAHDFPVHMMAGLQDIALDLYRDHNLAPKKKKRFRSRPMFCLCDCFWGAESGGCFA